MRPDPVPHPTSGSPSGPDEALPDLTPPEATGDGAHVLGGETTGDDSQLANVDLQNMLQKQQQTLQMMSNVAKMLHDSAQAVVRKPGG